MFEIIVTTAFTRTHFIYFLKTARTADTSFMLSAAEVYKLSGVQHQMSQYNNITFFIYYINFVMVIEGRHYKTKINIYIGCYRFASSPPKVTVAQIEHKHRKLCENCAYCVVAKIV